MSEYDPDRAKQVLRWPVREGLLRYVHSLRENARTAYYVEVLTWAVRSPYIKGESKPPAVPKILKGM